MIEKKLILGAIGGLVLTFVAMCAFLPLLKKLKAKQEILSYVKLHEGKRGTPTMGGIAFVLVFILLGIIGAKGSSYLLSVSVAITAAYAVLGFLDDFIKVKFRRNMGLTSIQKAVFQLVIAVIVAIAVYLDNNIGGVMYIPFIKEEINIGAFIMPLVVFAFLGFTNGVNLTDGIDGLASTVTVIVMVITCVLITFDAKSYDLSGRTDAMQEMENLAYLSAVMMGALIAFLAFNCYPAKVFMGDTGSMALGALTACLAVFSKNMLTLILPCIMFVVSALSVIIQVISFKVRKKRVILMAPFHHHLQMKGWSEPRICAVYALITTLGGLIVLWGVL